MNNEGQGQVQNKKCINVHGVDFDISSILNDVTTSIQINIQNSFNDVLKDHNLYKSTHDAILQIPFVREMYIKNQELASQIEILEQQEQTIKLNIHEILETDPCCQSPQHIDVLKSNKMNKKIESDQEESEEEEQESVSEAESEEEEEEAESEEEEEEEEAESEEEEEEEEEAEEEEAEEEEEEEVYEIVIKNVTYYTTNEESGDIYSCVDGDVGEIVGQFKNKKPVFMKRK